MSIVSGWRSIFRPPRNLEEFQARFARVIEVYVQQQDDIVRRELRAEIDVLRRNLQSANERIDRLRMDVDDLQRRFGNLQDETRQQLAQLRQMVTAPRPQVSQTTTIPPELEDAITGEEGDPDIQVLRRIREERERLAGQQPLATEDDT